MPKELYAAFYKGTIITSGIAFMLGMGTTGVTSLSSFQVGYGFFILSIMLILIIILNNIMTKNTDSMSNIIINILPFAIMMSVAGSLMYFSMKYYEIIKEGRVSSGYNAFNNVTIYLLIIQLFTIYSAVSDANFDKNGVQKITSGALLLMAVLSGISTNITRVILKYFTTDGFEVPILKI